MKIRELIEALEVFDKYARYEPYREVVVNGSGQLVIKAVRLGDMSDEDVKYVEERGFWFDQEEWSYACDRLREG